MSSYGEARVGCVAEIGMRPARRRDILERVD